MGRKEIGDLLKRTSDIEKELKPLGGRLYTGCKNHK